jgi:shikimate kinase
MMGVGKSTVARLLAARTGCPAMDTDELVERRHATTVAGLFAEKGEVAFREAESEVLLELGRATGPLVVSVGGGAVMAAANREAMRSLGTVVWLRAGPATLAERVGEEGGRPLLERSPAGVQDALERIAVERQALYEEVADIVVDVDDISPDETVDVLLANLAEANLVPAGLVPAGLAPGGLAPGGLVPAGLVPADVSEPAEAAEG